METVRYALWGTRREDESWQEQLLLSEATAEQCAKVEQLAKRDGFVNIRRSVIDNAPPDFRSVLNI